MQQRYQVESHYRRDDNGEWVGVIGAVDGVSLWYLITDTDHEADDWNDGVVMADESYLVAQKRCDEMNHELEGKPLNTSQLLSIPAVMRRVQ